MKKKNVLNHIRIEYLENVFENRHDIYFFGNKFLFISHLFYFGTNARVLDIS